MARIFEEMGFKAQGKIIEKKEFAPFNDLTKMCNGKAIINKAEKMIDEPYTVLPASVYMDFYRNGNRSRYESLQGQRSRMIDTFAAAEYVERKGRFIDKLIDLLWFALEETTWVMPAHNNHGLKKGDSSRALTNAYVSEVEYVDLRSAEYGNKLAWINYFCKDLLDAQSPIISERIVYELKRRIIVPFMKYENGWMGFTSTPNNWNPYIVSFALTVGGLILDDVKEREQLIDRAMVILDNFTGIYYADGGCDEGPSYWGMAGASYLDCIEQIYSLSAGKINVYGNELVRKMGEYIAKVQISGNYYLNFADCVATMNPDYRLISRYGRLTNSETLYNFGMYNASKVNYGREIGFTYRALMNLYEPIESDLAYKPFDKVWFDGICVAETRDKNLFLGIKGGHNNESHNHNDIGSFVVYADGEPILIDVGVGTYTKDTFNANRYNIWTMQTQYHNLPVINGTMQSAGRNYYADAVKYNSETGSLTMELKTAYPNNSGLKSYIRSAEIEDECVNVYDSLIFDDFSGEVSFNLMTPDKPDIETQGLIKFKSSIRGSYDPELRAEVDEIIINDKRISDAWKRDRIYRIRLISEKFNNKTFSLKIFR